MALGSGTLGGAFGNLLSGHPHKSIEKNAAKNVENRLFTMPPKYL